MSHYFLPKEQGWQSRSFVLFWETPHLWIYHQLAGCSNRSTAKWKHLSRPFMEKEVFTFYLFLIILIFNVEVDFHGRWKWVTKSHLRKQLSPLNCVRYWQLYYKLKRIIIIIIIIIIINWSYKWGVMYLGWASGG